jgi:hypothetical protein
MIEIGRENHPGSTGRVRQYPEARKTRALTEVEGLLELGAWFGDISSRKSKPK